MIVVNFSDEVRHERFQTFSLRGFQRLGPLGADPVNLVTRRIEQ